MSREEIVAELQGYLDHKHGRGYFGNHWHPEAYRRGWDGWSTFIPEEPRMVVSYQDKGNWGWY